MTRQTEIFMTTALAAILGTSAHAVTSFDANVTNNAIFGSGNANGSYTVDRVGALELGLRAKLRFNSSNAAENTFNSNGDGTYSFSPGNPPTGFSFDPNNPTTPVWNFEWSINTDYSSLDASSSAQLDDYDYQLRMDADPSAATNFQVFDPINLAFADHSIGTNLTAAGAGVEAADATEYATLIAGNNLAQNSWSYEFFNSPGGGPLENFDPNVNGIYTIQLDAYAKGTIGTAGPIASTSIDVLVPEPGSIALLGLGGLALLRRRRG